MAKRENMRALAAFLRVTHLQSRRYSEIFVYEDCQTLKQLKKVIENHIGRGRPDLTLRYRGIILRHDAKVSYLVMDLRNIGSPRFSVNTGGLPRNWQEMATGSSDLMMMSKLLMDLKIDLEGCYGVKPCEQRLILEGKQLEDGKTFQECNAVFGSTLQLVARLRGGRAYCKPQLPRVSTDPHALRTSARPAVATPSTGRFFDIENTGSMMKIGLTKKATLWRAAVEGLNVEGTCSNGECDSFGQMAICPMGFNIFNVAGEFQCPICHEIFTPITCAFWKCTWMFEGRKRAGNIDMMSPWFDDGTKYERFDEGEGHRNMTDWINLIITAKEPRMIRTSVLHKRKSRANEAACAICFEELMSHDAGISMPNCEYMFHSECVRPWLLEGTCCSSCRNPSL